MLARLRRLWRSARSASVLGAPLRAADRVWWARVIRRSDLVDTVHVEVQLGTPVSARRAVRAYVAGGFRDGLSLNPLFHERLVSAQLPDADRVPALYAYLRTDPRRIETSLAWDAPGYGAERTAEGADAPGPLARAWASLRTGGTVSLRGGRPVGLDDLHAAAAAALAAPHPLPDAPVPSAALTLLWRLDQDDADGVALRPPLALLSPPGDDRGAQDAVLVLAVDGAPPPVRLAAAQLALGDARVHLTERAGDPPEAIFPAGTVIVQRAPGALIPEASLRRLTTMRGGPCAPLWLAPDGSIVSAGVLLWDGHPYRALAGHPREDALALGEELEVAVLDAPVRMRIAGEDGPPRVLLRESVLGRHPDGPLPEPPATGSPLPPPQPRGLRTDTALEGGRTPRYVRAQETFRLDDGVDVPRLRWAVKTAAPAGREGESWGETHFARALAAALERLGQYVAVDARPALDRPSSPLDDVVLALRGPHPLPAPATACTMLWIISHPDEVTAAEVAGYDLAYAASLPWTASASENLGAPIRPLLQCTDARRFHPTGRPRGDDLVFVGTARGIARPSVVEPLRAGRPVRVYGPDWRGYIPGSAIVATHVPNEQLPALYESAGAVLNDHWPAMRREGFVSNRLFDVVAAGGRAISDDVAGIADLFGAAVRTYADIPTLLELTSAPLDAHFGDDAEIAAVAARVRAEHSFDARARTLLDDALRRISSQPSR